MKCVKAVFLCAAFASCENRGKDSVSQEAIPGDETCLLQTKVMTKQIATPNVGNLILPEQVQAAAAMLQNLTESEQVTSLLQTKVMTKSFAKHNVGNLTLSEQVQAAAAMLQGQMQAAAATLQPEALDDATDTLQSLLTEVASTLASALPAVQTAHDAAVAEINMAAQQVEACAASSEGASSAEELQAATQHARTQHLACRHLEATAQATCDEWVNFRGLIPPSPPPVSFDSNEAFTNHYSALQAYVLQWMGEGDLKRQACATAQEAFSAHGTACSTRQLKFEEDYCSSIGGCEVLTSCLSTQAEHFQNVTEAELQQVEARKGSYRAIIQAQCSLNLIVTSLASGSSVGEGLLSQCAAEIDTGHLNITLPEIATNSGLCDTSQSESGPCSTEFISQEYAGFSHSECTPCHPPVSDWIVFEPLSFVCPYYAEHIVAGEGEGELNQQPGAITTNPARYDGQTWRWCPTWTNSVKWVQENDAICGWSFRITKRQTLAVGMGHLEMDYEHSHLLDFPIEIFTSDTLQRLHHAPSRTLTASDDITLDVYTQVINQQDHVEYRKNGELFHTSGGTVVYPWHVGGFFYNGPGIADAKFITC